MRRNKPRVKIFEYNAEMQFFFFSLWGHQGNIRELVETGKGNVPAEKSKVPFSGKAVSCTTREWGLVISVLKRGERRIRFRLDTFKN